VLREPQHERYFSNDFNSAAVRAGALEGSKDYGHEALLIVLNVVDFVPFVVSLLLSTF
jgi:hypothetical protein